MANQKIVGPNLPGNAEVSPGIAIGIPKLSVADLGIDDLVNQIRLAFEKNPAKYQSLNVDELQVVRLRISDFLQVSKNTQFTAIGGTGSPAFQNSWVKSGGYDPGFWLDPFGYVVLHGQIKSGTVGSAAFTLPPGYRPTSALILPVISNDAIGRLDIGTDGTVTPKSPSSNVYVSLDGIKFKP